MKKVISHRFLHHYDPQTLILAISPFFKPIIFITETFLYTPVFHKGDMLKKKMLYHTKLSYCFILPLITLTYVPRILNLLMISRSFILALALFISHTVLFAILVGTKYRDEWRKNKTPLVQSYITSFFAPCIVMSPDSNLLLLSNVVSTVPHIVYLFLIFFGRFLEGDNTASFFLYFIPWNLLSPMFAWLLQAYSQEKTQEILLNGISFKLVKFIGSMFVLRALDEISDILTAMEYFMYVNLTNLD